MPASTMVVTGLVKECGPASVSFTPSLFLLEGRGHDRYDPPRLLLFLDLLRCHGGCFAESLRLVVPRRGIHSIEKETEPLS